jgi:hypothetical protein
MTGQSEGLRPEKQPASIRKIQANRQNALKSTGPKSHRGKEHSRRNAIKHGLFVLDPFNVTKPTRRPSSNTNTSLNGWPRPTSR